MHFFIVVFLDYYYHYQLLTTLVDGHWEIIKKVYIYYIKNKSVICHLLYALWICRRVKPHYISINNGKPIDIIKHLIYSLKLEPNHSETQPVQLKSLREE